MLWTSKDLVPLILIELVRLGISQRHVQIFMYLKQHREELIEQGIIGKEKNTDKLVGCN